jgi:hypothetical protein
MTKNISTALISVYDKTGLEEVVNRLVDLGITIYSTGGTYDFIKKLNHPVVSVDSLTEFPEILGGRVKTLHPKVFGGILNQRDSKSDQKEIKKHKIPEIDLVIVDLYPFADTVNDETKTHEDIIEKIDIGGISLLRAAGKNYKDVIVIASKDQYSLLLEVIKEGTSELEEREEFAIDAFNITSNYDAEIFKYLLDGDLNVPEGAGYFGSPQNQSGISINVSKDDHNLNDFLLCWEKFGQRPNRILIHNTYSSKLFNKAINDFILDKNVFTEVIPDSEELIINDKMFVKLDEDCYLSYIIADRNMDNSFIDSITFYFNNGYDKVQEFVELLNECVLDFCEDDSNKLNTISFSQNGLELEPVNFHNIDLENIEVFYNEQTFKQVEKTIKKIKKSDKGLTIFYGERGTGKTSIINHLATKLDRMIIFIPNNMIEHTINNPEFRRFIKKYERPIIVLDDCDMLFNDIYKTNPITNNILQMVDGFLADTMNVNIIALFNTDTEDDIEEELLDCNSLIDVIEFELLSVDESNELAKHLESNKKYKNKTRVIDIIKKRSSNEASKIGF